MDELGARTMAKVSWRLIPFAMLLFILCYLDRVNVSFAALQMNRDLGFSPTIYGTGAGIFFLGYFLCEVPSNLILHRVGASQWIARLMITWGLVSTATAWVSNEPSFYLLRFLLGVAEAGFFPGILLYLSYWFPAAERAKAISVFMTATAISNLVAAPLSTSILALDGWFGLAGWQLLFVIEGIPAVFFGLLVFHHMADRPQAADWLSEREKIWLAGVLANERTAKEADQHMTLKRGLLHPRVLAITMLCFCQMAGNFGVVFWMPQIIKAFGGLSNTETGLLTAIPYLFAMIAMVWWARRSDRRQDRKWHLTVSALLGAVGLAASALAPTPLLSFLALCAATVGIWSMFGVFWAIPGDFLCGTAAASGFALISSFGTLGGFTGPYLVGYVREKTGSFSASLLALAGFLLGAAFISALLRDEGRRLQPAA